MIQPTKQDKFSFGLWTIGWQARDTFGDATRPPLDPVVSVSHLGELGAWGVTFPDDDLIPFGSDEREGEPINKRFPKAGDGAGGVVAKMTTNLLTPPMFKEGAFTANDRG